MLKHDVILLLLGAEYQQFNAICARTLLIDCSEEAKRTYARCEELLQALVDQLRPGAALKDLYAFSVKFLRDHLPGAELPPSFGSGIGLEIKESILQVN